MHKQSKCHFDKLAKYSEFVQQVMHHRDLTNHHCHVLQLSKCRFDYIGEILNLLNVQHVVQIQVNSHEKCQEELSIL